VLVPDGVLFPVGPDEPQCFTADDSAPDEADRNLGHSFVIVRAVGEGLIVGLGDNEPFTNEFLRRGDNSGVAVALLVPDRSADVTFLLGRDSSPTVNDVGSGDETLRDLIPPWVWMSLTLGAVAFIVFAVSRSARVGRLVSEPIAAPIAGSELVSATGNLMERAGHAERAGWLLRERLHRDLCRSHGVDIGAPLDELDRIVGLRSGSRSGEVEALLRGNSTGTASLIELTAAIDRLRNTVFGSGPAVDDVQRPNDDRSREPAHPDERVST
jgi:hypothetical protein